MKWFNGPNLTAFFFRYRLTNIFMNLTFLPDLEWEIFAKISKIISYPAPYAS